jgi:hypothetical protein
MPKLNATFSDFSEGEVSYKMRGRADIPIFKSVAEWLQNFIAYPQGPVTFRPGTQYVHHTRRHKTAVLIPFFFNDIQAYLLEMTAGFIRFYKSTGIITENGKNITGITNSNPGTVTVPAHGYANGDEVFIYNTIGMEEVDGRSFLVANSTTNTFDLHDDFGNPVDTTSYSTYISGGQTFRIYEIASPYLEADLPFINYGQATDIMYLVNRAYAPRKLTIIGETNWTLNTFARVNDPFGTNNWPGAVSFTSDGRLIYGGTGPSPNTVWGSAGPATNGGSRFDDFTRPASPVAVNSYVFTLAVIHGESDSIRWISNTDNFLVIGTFGSVRYMYGSALDQPVTPLSVNARSVNTFGAAFINPVPLGPQMLYCQRSGNVIRSIEYDYLINGYQSLDKNLVSDHILNSGLKTLTNQSGIPDILWGCRNDGELVGMTYNAKENKYGWHRHQLGGAKVEWVQRMPRENNQDMLWMICNRTDNQGRTVRHIEHLAPLPQWPIDTAFYTGDKDRDNERFLNVLYEQQKNGVYVDASASYDGSEEGFIKVITMTPSAGATVGDTTNVLFTSDAAFFTANMVGRQIWKAYDVNGNGGGRAVIDVVNSPTTAHCTILNNGFDNLNPMVPGAWFITATTVRGLNYLEGKEVTICNDGALYGTQVVTNGSVVLTKPSSKITVGLPYIGILKTVGVDLGSKSGPAMTKLKNIVEFRLKLFNTGGISIGADLYNLKKIEFRQTGQITGRPIPLFTGIERVILPVDNSTLDKHCYIVQDKPFPCTINSFDPFVETSEV